MEPGNAHFVRRSTRVMKKPQIFRRDPAPDSNTTAKPDSVGDQEEKEEASSRSGKAAKTPSRPGRGSGKPKIDKGDDGGDDDLPQGPTSTKSATSRNNRPDQQQKAVENDEKARVSKSAPSSIDRGDQKQASARKVKDEDEEHRASGVQMAANFAEESENSREPETTPVDRRRSGQQRRATQKAASSQASQSAASNTAHGSQKRKSLEDADNRLEQNEKKRTKSASTPSSASRGGQKQDAAQEVEEIGPSGWTPGNKSPSNNTTGGQKRKASLANETSGEFGDAKRPKSAPSSADGGSPKQNTREEGEEPKTSGRTAVDTRPSINIRQRQEPQARQEIEAPKSADQLRVNTTTSDDICGSQVQNVPQEVVGISSDRQTSTRAEFSDKPHAEQKKPAAQEDEEYQADSNSSGSPSDKAKQVGKANESDSQQAVHGNEEPECNSEKSTEQEPVRRSGRVRKKPAAFQGGVDTPTEKSTKSRSASSASHQNLKFKSTSNSKEEEEEEGEEEAFDLPGNLLEASLAPWEEGELAECRGWTDFESDPAFMREIMSALGVERVNVQELLSVDEESFASLPQPVYGIVFLFEYSEVEYKKKNRPDDLPWFANQTTENACATIALMNILMNTEQLSLGPRLEEIKKETKDLSPPLRGHRITSDPWIRYTHNSYARRLDLLDVSLAMQNKVDSRNREKRQKTSRKKTKSTGGADNANHYIAFVPVGNNVWHLDGLTKEPTHVATFNDGESWTEVLAPVLEERVVQCANDNVNFNIMAICAPENEESSEPLRVKLATNIRHLRAIQTKVEKLGGASFSEIAWPVVHVVSPNVIFENAAQRLEDFDLDKDEIERLYSREQVSEAEATETVEKGLDVWRKLCEEQIEMQKEYRKIKSRPGDQWFDSGRKKDFTSFIHEWVLQLDEVYPALEDLFNEAELQNEIRKSGSKAKSRR
ncbi:hypothetical protein QBC42DRAFT_50851 [Cladorrhinum samala]|uniref:ubiquitinyl hydrolase 1 n=1 Tax=Cladorrhinum samala TaxID=585594 RepID=A0AAV9HX37_9PEZI|nr:hypothetical protein QBC42DRAFT_50851 [Cladorrhinum samala]